MSNYIKYSVLKKYPLLITFPYSLSVPFIFFNCFSKFLLTTNHFCVTAICWKTLIQEQRLCWLFRKTTTMEMVTWTSSSSEMHENSASWTSTASLIRPWITQKIWTIWQGISSDRILQTPSLWGQPVYWIGAQFSMCKSLDFRVKSLKMFNLCRNDKRKRKNKKKQRERPCGWIRLQFTKYTFWPP